MSAGPGKSWPGHSKRVRLPEGTDQSQLPLDGAGRAAQAGRELAVRQPLHLPRRDLAQGVVRQAGEPCCALVGRLGGEFGTRLVADHLLEFMPVGGCPAAAFQPPFVGQQPGGLAGGERDEDPPEVVPVVELRETALLDPLAEAVERGQGHVFLVGHVAAQAPQPGELDEENEVAISQGLGGLQATRLELAQPVRD